MQQFCETGVTPISQCQNQGSCPTAQSSVLPYFKSAFSSRPCWLHCPDLLVTHTRRDISDHTQRKHPERITTTTRQRAQHEDRMWLHTVNYQVPAPPQTCLVCEKSGLSSHTQTGSALPAAVLNTLQSARQAEHRSAASLMGQEEKGPLPQPPRRHVADPEGEARTTPSVLMR